MALTASTRPASAPIDLLVRHTRPRSRPATRQSTHPLHDPTPHINSTCQPTKPTTPRRGPSRAGETRWPTDRHPVSRPRHGPPPAETEPANPPLLSHFLLQAARPPAPSSLLHCPPDLRCLAALVALAARCPPARPFCSPAPRTRRSSDLPGHHPAIAPVAAPQAALTTCLPPPPRGQPGRPALVCPANLSVWLA